MRRSTLHRHSYQDIPFFFFMPTKKSPAPAAASRTVEESALDQGSLLGLVGYNCRQAYLSIMPLFVKRMAKYDLRPAEYTVITLINANPNMTQKQLSQAINVSPPNLATLLDRLEARGFVQRQRNPNDKRSQILVLTTEGRKLCKKADKTAFELENEATSMLSDAERAELLRLLQKVFL
jgi:DNA-binding MarR family transcriptional regulator